ncbi:Arginine--tRNA ligase, cytoplasmic, partial [Trichinella papuae]
LLLNFRIRKRQEMADEALLQKLENDASLLLTEGENLKRLQSNLESYEEDPELCSMIQANQRLRYRIGLLKTALAELNSNKCEQEANFDNSILQSLKLIFAKAVCDAFPTAAECPIIITETSSEKHGDYQFNSCMAIAKFLSNSQSTKIPPRKVAEEIVNVLMTAVQSEKQKSLIDKIEIAGPGFLNIFLNFNAVHQRIFDIFINGVKPPVLPAKRVVVDFSSPNIAKEMHVGHLRSTIIGDCICRLLEFCGFDVLRLNHVGDWGTQFGMLIAHLKDRFPNYQNEPPHLADLQSFYKESKVRFDADEEFKSRALKEVVKLQAHEPEQIKAWTLICQLSRHDFQRIYDKLDVKLVERGLLEIDEGRKIVFPESCSTPLTIVKSDGGYTYDTSDLAALKHRLFEEKADWVLYVVDAGQGLHFQQIFTVGKQLGWWNENSHRVQHIAFGLVLGEDKRKFRTRSGETVKLSDLLEEGMRRSAATLKEKQRDQVLSPKELDIAQRSVAYGCIKYADLSHNRKNDYVFSFDKMLEDKGNTAVYLLYAYSRMRSISRNAKVSRENLQEKIHCGEISFDHPKELKLMKMIIKFPDIISQVVENFLPNLICDYIYNLATVFTEFYDECYCIEKDPTTGALVKINYNRLILCEVTADLLCFWNGKMETVGKRNVGSELDRHLSEWIPAEDMASFKTAFYTAALFTFLAVVFSLLGSVCCLLASFAQPILWAVLFGTVLFPLKKSLVNAFECWLDEIQHTQTPFAVGLLVLPWRLAEFSISSLVARLARKSNILSVIIYVLLWSVSRNGPLLPLFRRLWNFLDGLLLFGFNWFYITLSLVYFIVICVVVNMKKKEPNKYFIRALSVPVWYLVICIGSNIFGKYRVLAAMAFVTFIVCVALDVFKDTEKPQTEKDFQMSHFDYLERIIGAALLLFILKHNYMFALMGLLLTLASMRKICQYFDGWKTVVDFILHIYWKFHDNFSPVLHIWFPHQMRDFFNLCFFGSPNYLSKLRNCSSILSTVIVMVVMMTALILLLFFFVVQIGDESASLAMLSFDLLNRTWTSGNHLPMFVENALSSHDRQAFIEDGYLKARSWLGSKARSMLQADDDNGEKGQMLENQLLLILDNIYDMWKSTNRSNLDDQSTLTTVWVHLHTDNFSALSSGLIHYLQANFAIVSSILEVTWNFLLLNLNAIITLAIPLLGEIFTFGFSLFNMLLQFIMFLTTLFYLLECSKDVWKPVEMLAGFVPFLSTPKGGESVFFVAFQRSVRSVFVISFKMSTFYGLYTWLMYSLFGLSMTVLPSVIASLLAAVPVVPPSIACFPGCLELWLANGESTLAVLFLICSFAPSIESHPFLTALSVCGGVYWLGLQGAIIGPVLLCCFLFVNVLYRSVGKSFSDSSTIH